MRVRVVRSRCRNCGRVLTHAAWLRGEWLAKDELYDTLAGPQERDASEHIGDCEGFTMKEIREATK